MRFKLRQAGPLLSFEYHWLCTSHNLYGQAILYVCLGYFSPLACKTCES